VGENQVTGRVYGSQEKGGSLSATSSRPSGGISTNYNETEEPRRLGYLRITGDTIF